MNTAQYQVALGNTPAKPKKATAPKSEAKPVEPAEITEETEQGENEIDGAGE